MSAPSSSAERMLPTRAAVPVIGGFFALFFGFLALPRVRATPGLFWAFIGAGLVMLLAVGALALRDRRSGRRLQIQLWPKREHTVQLVVQLTIFGYWGWYWRPVYEQMPLILAQVVFAYLVDLVLAWRRYGRWRLGLGQFPITFSTNLFMWFRDPLFGFQFAMMALAYLSRDALVWRREGQRTHIFNPSAFGLAIASVTLIIGEWAHQTYGSQIALSLGYPPFAFEWIFLCGVVVQLFFRVTLVTFSAAMAAWVFGAVFYLKTGVWLYVDTAIPIAVFLGMNLLVTDPVSSPRSNGGKVLFGVLYGVAVCVLYGVLRDLGRPATETDPGLHVSWLDKLLFLPVLNLLARPLDAIGRHLNFKRFGWKFGPPATNRVHVALWVGAFVALRPWLIDHPGRSHDFWREACTEGRFRACENLLLLYDKSCESGIGAACHNLGVMVETGEAGPVDLPRAAYAYDQGCARDFAPACRQLGVLFTHGRGVEADPVQARRLFQRACDAKDAGGCTFLGAAMRDGLGGPPDVLGARRPLRQACDEGDLRGCQELALALVTGPSPDPAGAAVFAERACKGGQIAACVELGIQRQRGHGVPRDPAGAADLFRQACAADHPVGCSYYGGALRTGTGVTADPAAAVQFYEKGCQLGDMPGCADLGRMYTMGLGVPRDMARARSYVERACHGGLAPACEQLRGMSDP